MAAEAQTVRPADFPKHVSRPAWAVYEAACLLCSVEPFKEPRIFERVYVNTKARAELGWTPQYDFRAALNRLSAGQDTRSALAIAVGAKGYHPVPTGPYTAER